MWNVYLSEENYDNSSGGGGMCAQSEDDKRQRNGMMLLVAEENLLAEMNFLWTPNAMSLSTTEQQEELNEKVEANFSPEPQTFFSSLLSVSSAKSLWISALSGTERKPFLRPFSSLKIPDSLNFRRIRGVKRNWNR